MEETHKVIMETITTKHYSLRASMMLVKRVQV